MDLDFVVGKIGLVKVRSLLEHDDAKTICGKFLGQNATGSTGTNDDEIHFVRSFVLHSAGCHFFSALADCQPG